MDIDHKKSGYVSHDSWVTNEKVGAIRVNHLAYPFGGLGEEILVYDHTREDKHSPFWRGTLADLIKKLQE